jgi:hypothetical protein
MMADLIPAPILDERSGSLLAAQAIARVSGGATVELIDRYIEMLREVRTMVAAGAITTPLCPELTNANSTMPHVAMIEVLAWLVEQIEYRTNQIPDQNKIAFANLFKIGLREATVATTSLVFTVAPPAGVGVTIPAGTEVHTADGEITFETGEELTIPAGEVSGTVAAQRTVTGLTILAPNTLTKGADQLAWVMGVTNPEAVESGSETETTTSALERARHYQRRGERWVTDRDVQEGILEEVLQGNGIVKVWSFVKDGDWQTPRAGHTTVVVMTRTGDPVSDDVKAAIRTKLREMVGAQFTYIKDSTFYDFNVSANIKLTAFQSELAVRADVERRLRLSFAPSDPGNFGRTVSISDIIAIIKGASGVERVVPQPGGDILAEPAADIQVAPYEMPRLETVTLNVVV